MRTRCKITLTIPARNAAIDTLGLRGLPVAVDFEGPDIELEKDSQLIEGRNGVWLRAVTGEEYFYPWNTIARIKLYEVKA